MAEETPGGYARLGGVSNRRAAAARARTGGIRKETGPSDPDRKLSALPMRPPGPFALAALGFSGAGADDAANASAKGAANASANGAASDGADDHARASDCVTS